ncbi:MAG: alpha/beta hydrolase [Polyangiaceae bacterium]|jgi:pimeloyl-ACP methyl ester carboxylesterase|nr:alpha/beta hydrolase [Polyangiaceae bacterium]
MRIELVEQTLVCEQGGRPALWLIHGFGESGLSLRPLFATPLAKAFGLFAPDLPGFGASPPLSGMTSIDRLADVVVDLITRRTPEGLIGLVGHSLGSPVAVRVAQRLKARVGGLLSIEGNLTEADAYFSGRATLFDEPGAFKVALEQHVWGLAQENPTFRHYFASLVLADARPLWQVGLDVARASRGHALGEEYRQLSCPSLYCWSPTSTPEATQRYLRKHRIAEQRYEGAGHWPTVEAPLAIAAVIADFFRGRLSSSGPASSR